jgi:hypothetical protein
MTLKELIVWLESKDPKLVLSRGFNQPHSYRGIYADVAFVPCKDASVAEMLRDAKSALGETFGGWKGGEFEMNEWTDCWLAEIGDTGDAITGSWLEAEAALTALRERHAADVEAAFREGVWEGVSWDRPRQDDVDAAWLASDARRQLEEGR